MNQGTCCWGQQVPPTRRYTSTTVHDTNFYNLVHKIPPPVEPHRCCLIQKGTSVCSASQLSGKCLNCPFFLPVPFQFIIHESEACAAVSSKYQYPSRYLITDAQDFLSVHCVLHAALIYSSSLPPNIISRTVRIARQFSACC